MTYLCMALFAAGVVALDQWTKYLTVANIPLYSRVPFWDGLFHFTYVRNFGAAFSSFFAAGLFSPPRRPRRRLLLRREADFSPRSLCSARSVFSSLRSA